ncbi:MAG: TonB-dependent receptor, partial [Gammaproteobacteria bacterium]|nr:TonB-dependent receptor [Gammaproteobacteria bacterium]
HELGIGINLEMPTHFTERTDEEFKIGLNVRLRNKTGDATSYSVGNLPTLALPSAISGGNVGIYNGRYQNGPNIDGSVLRAIYAASTSISSDPVATALNNVNDKEDVYAAYGQYQFGYGALGVVVGARVEVSKATYAGNKNDQSPNPQTAGCTLLADGSTLCPVSKDRSYTNLFPTAQARYEFSPELIGRLALSSTIARPGFQQVTATTTVASNQDIVTGNPNLNPTTAYGLDATIEQYLPHAGILSAGLFTKQIKDYIVTNVRTLAYQNTGGLLGLAKEFSYTNAPTAHLYGVELNYAQRFKDQLPGALGGLGVSVNWAWVQSKYEIRSGEYSLLPSTSRNTVNAELLYDYAGLDLALGAYYTSRNIFGVAGSAATDVWTQDRIYLDFGSQYRVSKPLSLYFNVKNLANTPLKLTEGPGANRVIQREFYSTTYQAGLSFSF